MEKPSSFFWKRDKRRYDLILVIWFHSVSVTFEKYIIVDIIFCFNKKIVQQGHVQKILFFNVEQSYGFTKKTCFLDKIKNLKQHSFKLSYHSNLKRSVNAPYNFTIPLYTTNYYGLERLYICCHYEYEKMSGNRQWRGKVFLVLEQFFLFS